MAGSDAPAADRSGPPRRSRTERWLCLRCAEPLPPTAHFCHACLHPQDWMANTLPFESIWARGWLLGVAATEPPPGRLLLTALWLVALPALTHALFTSWFVATGGADLAGWGARAAIEWAPILVLWWVTPLMLALPLAATLGRGRLRRPPPAVAPWRPAAGLVVALAVAAPLVFLLGLLPGPAGALRLDGETGVVVGPLVWGGLAHLAVVLAVAWVMARGIVRAPPPA
jgi:hypothetical protein